MAAVRESKKWPVIVIGISFIALLHGLYDLFSYNIIGIAIAAFGYIIYMAYLIHTDKKE